MCLFLLQSIPDAGTNCRTSLSILSFQDACLYGFSIRLVSDPATTDVCLPVEERLTTAGGVMPVMGTYNSPCQERQTVNAEIVSVGSFSDVI